MANPNKDKTLMQALGLTAAAFAVGTALTLPVWNALKERIKEVRVVSVSGQSNLEYKCGNPVARFKYGDIVWDIYNVEAGVDVNNNSSRMVYDTNSQCNPDSRLLPDGLAGKAVKLFEHINHPKLDLGELRKNGQKILIFRYSLADKKNPKDSYLQPGKTYLVPVPSSKKGIDVA